MPRLDAMSRAQPQPDHAQAIQDFLDFIEKQSVKGTHGPSSTVNRPFMPLNRLESYFEGQYYQRTNDILQALFSTDESPVEPAEILQKCPRVFAILLCIGKGKFIESFARHYNLRDNKLPFDARPKNFPNTTDDDHFWESFYKQQWQFCPHIFQNDTDTELEKEWILPIIHKERLAEGGSAVAYKIKLHSAYDQLNTSAVRRLDPSERFANTYVLKTYRTKDAYVYYKSEVDAFKKLVWDGSPDSSIIGFYGSYIQDGTYNVLLEYADKGNLEEYFQKTQPPSTGDDVIRFWTSLFNLLKALSRIHQVRRTANPNVATGLQIFQGWHQDVKPANVLVVTGKSDSPYDCDFKLADLGLSHFQRTVEPQLDDLGRDNNGTREYGAPECYRWDEFLERSKLQVPRSVDIWSLGCIYSEAAVWVVLGNHGLRDYRRKRKAETDRIFDFKDGGCFHDSAKVLDTVQNFHSTVRQNVRKNDHITELVLDMISDMLVAATSSRPPANFLYNKSGRNLQTARERLLKSTKLEPVSSPMGHGEDRPKTPPELPPELTHSQSDPASYTSGPRRSTSQKDSTWLSSAPQDVLTRKRYSSPDRMTDADNESPRTTVNFGSSPHTSPPGTGHMERPGIHGHVPAGSDYQNAMNKEAGKYEDPFIEHGLHQSMHNSAAYRSKPHDTTQPQHKPQKSASSHLNMRDSIILNHQPSFNSHTRQDTEIANATQLAPNQLTTASSPPRVAGPPVLKRVPTKDPPPRLTIENASKWIRQKEGGASVAPLVDKRFLNDLNRRDHVFLVDDAMSMQKHWDKVMSVFYVLAYMVKDSDPDGMDLLYTVSLEKQKSKRPDRLREHLRTVSCGGRTDISLRLSAILHEYAENLRAQATPRRILGIPLKKKQVRPMNLYILTDAIWQPLCDAAKPIKTLIRKLDELGLPEYQVGIQFIRFGQNQDSIDRLEHLDSGLELSRDIVDSEACDGNVWKMLLGAVNKWFDEDEADVSNNKAYG